MESGKEGAFKKTKWKKMTTDEIENEGDWKWVDEECMRVYEEGIDFFFYVCNNDDRRKETQFITTRLL